MYISYRNPNLMPPSLGGSAQSTWTSLTFTFVSRGMVFAREYSCGSCSTHGVLAPAYPRMLQIYPTSIPPLQLTFSITLRFHGHYLFPFQPLAVSYFPIDPSPLWIPSVMPPLTPSLPSLATPHSLQRGFHTSSTARASILFALHALSNSRETQHFAKLTRLPRTEHSPPLKLIKSSEVDAYPLPSPPSPPPSRPLIRAVGGARSTFLRLWDTRALQIGRVLLTDQARQTHRLQKSLSRAHRRSAQREALLRRARVAWQKERGRMRNEMRWAGIWILASIGTATALATWRFWPEGGASRRPDSGELGRRIAARAAEAMPLPKAIRSESVEAGASGPAVSIEPTITAPIAVPVPSQKEAEREEIVPSAVRESGRSWWRSLFWKQQ